MGNKNKKKIKNDLNQMAGKQSYDNKVVGESCIQKKKVTLDQRLSL